MRDLIIAAIAALGILAALAALFGIAICIAAGRADQAREKALQQRRRQNQ